MLYNSMYWYYKNSIHLSEVLNLPNKPKLFACSTSGIVYDNEVVVQKQVKNNTDKIKIEQLTFLCHQKRKFFNLENWVAMTYW